MSTDTALRGYWENQYETTDTPFDVDTPDEWIDALEKSGKIHGEVLDAGCGPGRTALVLADRGYSVTGLDISANAISRAQKKAAAQGSPARFAQADLCDLSGYDGRFDTVIDIGCFHSLRYADDRAAYAAALRRACRAGATVYLRAFSETNMITGDFTVPAGGDFVPALTEAQIRDAFSVNGWTVQTLAERRIDLLVADGLTILVYAWFAEIHAS